MKELKSHGHTPVLSIIVTVYNGEETLQKCLRSIYRQTFQRYEIICVDDGSTDRSLEILKQEAQKNTKVKVIHQSNRGAWFARKRGIREATGEWIGFVDCDDTIEKEMYRQMLLISKQHQDIDMVVCGFQKVDAQTGRIYARQMTGFGKQVIDTADDNLGFLVTVNPSMCNKIFRLHVVKHAIALEKAPRIMEDLIFISSILPLLKKVAFTDQTFYQYYNHKNSVTKTIGYQDILCAKEALSALKVFWDNRYQDHALLELLALLHLGIAMTINYNQKEGKNNMEIWKEVTRYLDCQFPCWNKNPYLKFGYCRRYRFMWKFYLASLCFRTPVFPAAVGLYHVIERKWRLDLKW